MQYTSIRVTKQLKKELDARGKRGQSYEDIIKEGMRISFEPTIAQKPSLNIAEKPIEKELAAKKTLLPRLSGQPEKVAEIKRIWETGEYRAAIIATAIGYPRQTTQNQINRMKKSGDII